MLLNREYFRDAARRRRAEKKDHINSLRRKAEAKNPLRTLLNNAKANAKRRGLPFNLSAGDLSIPQVCPVLGITIERGAGLRTDASPSLDRIIPEQGYVKGNVIVVSWRANRIKNDATISELQIVADFYTSLTEGSLK